MNANRRFDTLGPVKYGCFILFLAVVGLAQEKPLTLGDLGSLAEQWARDNLDEEVFKALGNVDHQKATSLFNDLSRALQGESVYDLAKLKGGAKSMLPHLKKYEGTRPYAAWLEAHLDYLIVADELQRKSPTPANPTPEQQRPVWDEQMQKRPLPARAQTYVPRLKPIFTSQGAPTELVWLAEIESSFDPSARSPAGAVGLYQLMPATARSLGLALSPHDERLEAEKNGRAAAKYLRYLYNRFGDWRLALAAYNAGETRVNSLLTKYRARSYSAIATRLPAETQMYVPKFEATLQKREGLALTMLRVPRT